MDHRNWGLPNNSSPADVDMVIHNRVNDYILEVELKTDSASYHYFKNHHYGQWGLHKAFVNNGNGKQFYALAKHYMPDDRAIDTINDIQEFSFLVYDNEIGYKSTPIYPGEIWQASVFKLMGYPMPMDLTISHNGITFKGDEWI
ncbi:MAG: hypothetical protein WDZ51_06210 [Pirellulaceae bacterium]